MDIIDETLLEKLAVSILDEYKDGEYAFNDELKKQSKSHYNAKKSCMNSLSELFTQTTHRPSVKYIKTLTGLINDYHPEVARDWKRKYHQSTRTMRQLQDKVKLLSDGQNSSMCGTCHYQVKAEIDKRVSEYVCDKEDVLSLTEKISSLKSRCRFITEKLEKMESYRKNISENYHAIPNDEWYEMVDNNAKASINKSSPKDDGYKKKYKKAKKELIKVQAELILLKGEQTSDSDSESGSD
tara:strand:- start:2 stop:721 length:720 start_codon:yes stop_codon:yes gene_type:complete